MSRAQAAVQRLYESADLRDELTDEEAEALLKWAEAELARLDRADASDDAYAAQVDTLLKLIKQVNRYAGRQGQAAAQSAEEAPTKIAELAASLGHLAGAEQVAAAGTGDPVGTIRALTNLLSESAQSQSAASAGAGADTPSAPPPPLPQATDQVPSLSAPNSPDQPITLLPSGDDPVDL
jgi:hypothetical protein